MNEIDLCDLVVKELRAGRFAPATDAVWETDTATLQAALLYLDRVANVDMVWFVCECIVHRTLHMRK